MGIEIQLARSTTNDDAAQYVIDVLRAEDESLGLQDALLYYGYPRYRDEEDSLVSSQILVASPQHGIIILGTLNESARDTEALMSAVEGTEAFLAMVNAKMLSNRALRANPRTLAFPLDAHVYAPLLEDGIPVVGDLDCFKSASDLRALFEKRRDIDEDVFAHIVATLDGSRNIPRPKKRELESLSATSKGHLVARLESELARFDVKQREGSIANVTGPQRIRGLAGSGKTIVLTRKAALLHLDDPESAIAYTFHTKSPVRVNDFETAAG